jgi:hypothetical protein
MSHLDHFLTTDSPISSSRRMSLFEYVAKVLVPILGILATIVGALRGVRTITLLGLIGVTAFSLVLGLLPMMNTVIGRSMNHVRDRRAARLYLPQLRTLAHQFQDFVNGSRSDTLHYISDNFLCEGHGQKMAKLAMPSMAAWTERAILFSRKLDRQKPNYSELQVDVLEFYDMVGTYDSLCAGIIVERLPAELAAMTPRAKSNLGAFQQRFERFLWDAERLLKDISASRPSLESSPRCFAPVRPLP